MSVVLITLKGPLQAWSLDQYRHRRTRTHPTKSGVLGLVAASMGLENGTPEWLANLRYGVRTIKPGRPMTELQTMGVRTNPKGRNPLTWHGYLMDAEFLTGLEGDDRTCRLIEHAIGHPVYTPYLGRRDCPPGGPIPVQVTTLDLETALQGPGDIHMETPDGQPVWDQPQEGRTFGSRGETLTTTCAGDDPFDTITKETQA